MTPQHTPTPWTRNHKTILANDFPLGSGERRSRETMRLPVDKQIAITADEEDAAFIVRACNNFESVLSALKMFCAEHTTPCDCENCAIIKRADK